MTVTYSLVGIASRNAYVPTGESDTTYVAIKPVAKAILDNDNPGLSTELYDWCHALIISHLALADETAGLKSYSTGEFSASQDPGMSIHYLQYKQIIESYSESVDYSSETDVMRSDANMPDFHLDQAEVPSYFLGV